MITATSSGSFGNTNAFLKKIERLVEPATLHKFGAEGVAALQHATPVESSLTAQSWDYEVGRNSHGYFIVWTNSDIESGFPVAIMLQYGYGTGTGGYVQGRDYINPALRPIFDRFTDHVWKGVTSA